MTDMEAFEGFKKVFEVKSEASVLDVIVWLDLEDQPARIFYELHKSADNLCKVGLLKVAEGCLYTYERGDLLTEMVILSTLE